jgi:hypothetical protein
MATKRVKHLKQRASITGMGNTSFDTVMLNLARIHAIFKRRIGNQLEEDTVHSEYNGYSALDTSNRYFTPKSNTGNEETVPLGAEVDPQGTLMKVAGGAYIHTEDNKVHYYEKSNGRDGSSM